MQSYDKHRSWVKSPWNYVSFLLESPLNSLDLDLGKVIERCNSFLAKVRESQGTWVPKSRGESGNFAKKIWWKLWRSVTQFCRIRCRKSLFAKSKLTNLKNSGGEEDGEGVRGVHKSIHIHTPSVCSLSGIAHSQEMRQGAPCMSSTRLSRSGLISFI